MSCCPGPEADGDAFKMSKSCSIVIFLLAACLSAGLLAQSDDRNLGDHPLIERFPDSTLEEIEVIEDSNYRLVLGTLQRNREEVVPEDSLRLRGDVTKITYQVSQEFSGSDVHDFFRQQMAEKNYTELFSCSGRACGSSNYWANDIFRNRILYGPERNQYFIAMRSGEDAGSAAHISLYIITRANRRIYAYVEIVEDDVSRGVVSIASPELLETLNDRGSVALPGIVFADDSSLAESADLTAVLELLRSNPGLQFYLVVHLAGDGELETLIDRSTNRAEFLKQQLLQAGIAPERLTARGVGPLAPACDIADCAERVELVLR
jgi:outer membrane protein OmpA-like peptidoglycan-associated protein